MSPRSYRLGHRLAAIQQTRDRIVAAATDLLSAKDLSGFTVDAVASRAGVARMTVYYQFGSKTGLIEALFDRLAGRELLERLRAGFGQREPFDALGEFIGAFVGFWASDRTIIRRLQGLARFDPETERGVQAQEASRRAALHSIVGRLAAERGRPVPAGIEETTDVLQVLTSFDAFDALAGTKRSAEEVAMLLIRLAHAAVDLDQLEDQTAHGRQP